MGWWAPLWDILCWMVFIFILCPAGIWIVFRLVFTAYFVTKSKQKEGGSTDGEK